MSDRCALIVPGDPAQLTGGYLYDARMASGLSDLGWQIDICGLPGRFPRADSAARSALDDCLATRPDGSCVIIDGLALGGLPDIAARHAHRLRLVALIHHPLCDETGLDDADRAWLFASEQAALALCRRVVTTSAFTAARLAMFGLPASRIHVIPPGVNPAPLTPADGDEDVHAGVRLLCVASLTRRKGHDVLVRALATLQPLRWQCDLVGSPARDPAFAAEVSDLIHACGLAQRIHLHGEIAPEALSAHYLASDLFVLPSHYEGHGMVIDEAIAHGLPVVTTTGGALRHTLPHDAGIAVAPGDVARLADALRQVITDSALRRQLRAGALAARLRQRRWSDSCARLANLLATIE